MNVLASFLHMLIDIKTPSPTPTTTAGVVPILEPSKPACNTSIPVNNPVCRKGFTCVPDPDIFCIQVFPSTCLNGMCVPHPSPIPTATVTAVPEIEPTKPACNTSIPIHNPVCGDEFACVQDPDIFCIAQFPNPCLNGMCVPRPSPIPIPTTTTTTPAVPSFPTLPACNTSIPVNNPECGFGYLCHLDSRIVCNLPLPNPCLNGMCVPI